MSPGHSLRHVWGSMMIVQVWRAEAVKCTCTGSDTARVCKAHLYIRRRARTFQETYKKCVSRTTIE
jgi:hypothetical protein